MLTESAKLKWTGVLVLLGLALGAAMVVAELFHGPKEAVTFESFASLQLQSRPWAEQAVTFFFGAVHLVVAALITVYRRTST